MLSNNDKIAILSDGNNDVATDDEDVGYKYMYLEIVFNKM